MNQAHVCLTQSHIIKLLVLFIVSLLAACGAQSAPSPIVTSTSAVTTAAATTAPTEQSAAGDVPDNAVFVTYTSQDGGYSIQYVEGWTVTPGIEGSVAITDIDSVEMVDVISMPSGDLTTYITGTDETKLKPQVQDYQRTGLETIQVHNQPVVRLTYTGTSAPDAVTGKQRPVETLRYYIPNANGKLAILTLTTPVGVDNVDAFNQMLGSFTWQ